MSYTEDHWILVSGHDATARGTTPLSEVKSFGNAGPQPARWAHEIATKIFRPGAVSQVMPSAINYEEYFSVAPDGSGAGWDESDEHDVWRSQFLASLIVGHVRHRH